MKPALLPMSIVVLCVLTFWVWQPGADERQSSKPVTVSIPDSGEELGAKQSAVADLQTVLTLDERPVDSITPGETTAGVVVSTDERGDRVVNVGEYQDPDDPSTWPRDENEEVVNVGVYMDPDDPSTWPVDENADIVNVGVYMDPDDPSTWSVNSDLEAVSINVGEYQDPDNSQLWPLATDDGTVNVSEYRDPGDPSNSPQD